MPSQEELIEKNVSRMMIDLDAIAIRRERKELEEFIERADNYVQNTTDSLKAVKKEKLSESKKRAIKKSKKKEIQNILNIRNNLKNHLNTLDKGEVKESDLEELRKMNKDLLNKLPSELKMQYVKYFVTIFKSAYPVTDKAELVTGLLGMLATIKQEQDNWKVKQDMGLVNGEYVIPESFYIGIQEEEDELEFEKLKSEDDVDDMSVDGDTGATDIDADDAEDDGATGTTVVDGKTSDDVVTQRA